MELHHNCKIILEDMPVHDENFSQNVYVTALYQGYSDEEAHQIAAAQTKCRESSIKIEYQYPNPERFASNVEQDVQPLDAIALEQSSDLDSKTDYRDSPDEVLSTNRRFDSSRMEVLSNFVKVDEPTSNVQESKQHSILESNLISERSMSPSTISSTTSFQDTPGTSVSASVPLPDTYAGRRTAEGRSSFPRECGACGRRFLYEDSALKHYRKHHGEPPKIILRYDAPKRPPPGTPRNSKAAQARARQSATPPISTPTPVPSQDQCNQIESPDSTSPCIEQVTSLQPSNSICSSYNFASLDSSPPSETFEVEDDLASLSNEHATPHLVIHPDTGSAYIDFHGYYATGDNGEVAPISYTKPRFPQHDARYAAIQARQESSHSLPQTAPEEIARLNPHLLLKRLQHPRSPTLEDRRTVSNGGDDLPNIRYLKMEASRGKHPPLPPESAYDNNDSSLTFHRQFGSYYRRDQNGLWQRWCSDTACWEQK